MHKKLVVIIIALVIILSLSFIVKKFFYKPCNYFLSSSWTLSRETCKCIGFETPLKEFRMGLDGGSSSMCIGIIRGKHCYEGSNYYNNQEKEVDCK